MIDKTGSAYISGKKRIFSVLIAVAVMVSITVPAFAAIVKPSDKVYEVDADYGEDPNSGTGGTYVKGAETTEEPEETGEEKTEAQHEIANILNVLHDVIQSIGGFIFGGIVALAVIKGFKV